MNLRFSLFNSLSAFVVAYLVVFHDIVQLLFYYDKTHVTFLIFGIYVLCTFYLGWKGDKANFKALNFQRLELTALGLIGTIIAIILMFSHAGIDPSTFKQNVVAELSPVFLTSGFGIGFSWLLGQQMALCYGRHDHA